MFHLDKGIAPDDYIHLNGKDAKKCGHVCEDDLDIDLSRLSYAEWVVGKSFSVYLPKNGRLGYDRSRTKESRT